MTRDEAYKVFDVVDADYMELKGISVPVAPHRIRNWRSAHLHI
jgi:hypothetical protein